MNYRIIAFLLVLLGWFVFAGVFIALLRRKPAQEQEAAPFYCFGTV